MRGAKSGVSMKNSSLVAALAAGVCIVAMATPASAQTSEYRIPAGSLKSALDAFARQSGRQIIYKADEIRSARSRGVQGLRTAEAALAVLLEGTGFSFRADSSGAIAIVTGEAEAGATPADNNGADIVVTGSYIRGVNPTSPVRAVGRREIEQSGYSQTGDLMRSLPENFAGGQNPGVIGAAQANIDNNNQSGASSVNLRGLGSGATLVLLNGHRLAGDTQFQGADVSGIPLSALQRVEIMTDGASALYGSDAVAGVVNFITRKNYNGAEVSARVGGATQGGGFQQDYSALGGISRSSWHALVNYEYSRQNEINAGQRALTAMAPAVNSLSPSQESHSVFLNAGAELSSDASLSFDGLWSNRHTEFNVKSTATSGITLTSLNTPTYSAALTFQADLSHGWNLRVTGVASGDKNDISKAFVPTSTPGYGIIYNNNVQYAESTIDGPLIRLPSGDVKIAIGGGYRREGFHYQASTAITLDATRRVSYLYAEADVPIISPSIARSGLHELELSLSGRTEHYSDFGQTTNPKVGLRYVPFSGLTLRGTWGKSFKAPAFYQLYIRQTATLYKASTLGYSGPGLAILTVGGNKDLNPEKSTSWTVGGEYVPPFRRSMKVSATYYNIDYKDRVVQPVNSSLAFINPIYAPFIQYAPSPAEQNAVIAQADAFSNTSGLPYDPSQVVGIVFNQNQNATSQKIKGLDLAYSDTFNLLSGKITPALNATWLNFKRQTIVTSPKTTLSGTIFFPPKFKARGSLTWQEDGLSVTGIANYIGASTDNGVTPFARISPWTTVDATISYSFSQRSGFGKGMRMSLSASNLFDRNPPYAASPSRYVTGIYFDSTNYSAIGRFISFTLSKSW
jgi:outer membrane receptor protein involved in Fe transport